jgi:urea transporter
MATSELAPQPVSFYAATFFLVNATYLALILELTGTKPAAKVSTSLRRVMRWRPIVTMGLFGTATVVALKHPIAGLTICICCLVVYLKPEPSLSLRQGDRRQTHLPAKRGV